MLGSRLSWFQLLGPRLVVGLLFVGCGDSRLTPLERAGVLAMSPIPARPASPTNRFADLDAPAALGDELFFDAGLSIDGASSCATCHDPTRHFTDGERVHTALGTGNRNVPSIEGASWQTWFFWDGRADSAWSQAAGPITNPVEMGSSADAVRERIIEAHGPSWTAAFGPVPDDPALTLALTGKALEAYERTISPGRARFDDYVDELRSKGQSDILTPSEAGGLRIFIDAGCVLCHSGPLFTDGSFHNIGVPQVARGGMDIGRALGATEVLEDPYNCAGRFSDAHNPPLLDPMPSALGPDSGGCPELRFLDPSFADWPLAFKTPSLRNVAETAPFMHDGSITTLRGVVAFYNELPGTPLIGHRELTLTPLHLSDADSDDLVAFLGTLTSQGLLEHGIGVNP